jgi:hypothetical protein
LNEEFEQGYQEGKVETGNGTIDIKMRDQFEPLTQDDEDFQVR